MDASKAALWHKLDGDGKAPPAAEVIRAAGESLAHTEKFIADNAIHCQYGRNGRLSCAPTPAFYEPLTDAIADSLLPKPFFGHRGRALESRAHS